MTQEAKTPEQLRAEAEALEQAQWDREDPTWQRGVNTAYGAEYQRRLARIAQTHGEDAARELNNRVNAGELPTWDAFDDAVDGLRGGGASGGSNVYSGASPVQGMSRATMTLREAERRYVLPEGHHDKLTHAEFKEIRRQLGVRD